jgi:hypothetical protein
MRGSLWRVSNEQLRKATSEESLGAEVVNKNSSDMKSTMARDRSRAGDPAVENEEDHDDVGHDEDHLDTDSDKEAEAELPAEPEAEASDPGTPLVAGPAASGTPLAAESRSGSAPSQRPRTTLSRNEVESGAASFGAEHTKAEHSVAGDIPISSRTGLSHLLL